MLQVNAMFAAKIMADTEAPEGGKKKAKPEQNDLLTDERFQNLFEDPAYAIDEQAEEYKVLHPNAGKASPPIHAFFSMRSIWCIVRIHFSRLGLFSKDAHIMACICGTRPLK